MIIIVSYRTGQQEVTLKALALSDQFFGLSRKCCSNLRLDRYKQSTLSPNRRTTVIKISLLVRLVLRRVVTSRSRRVKHDWPCPPLQVPPSLLLMPYASRLTHLRLNPVLALLLFHQTLSSGSKPAVSFPSQQSSIFRLCSPLLGMVILGCGHIDGC